MILASTRTEGHTPKSVTLKWKQSIKKCCERSETIAILCHTVNLGESLAKCYPVTEKISLH